MPLIKLLTDGTGLTSNGGEGSSVEMAAAFFDFVPIAPVPRPPPK